MTELLKSSTLLLALLNPFLVIIYLVDIVQTVDRSQFTRILLRAGLISGTVFCAFAIVGDRLFSDLVQAEFASFQIFGGIVFLLIGLQFVFRGPTAIEILRGKSAHIAGAVAMPVLIGPGTISASVVIGKRHDALSACGGIAFAMVLCITIIILLKLAHDFVKPRNEPLIERYIEITGRISALYVGTISVQMIMQGIQTWGERF